MPLLFSIGIQGALEHLAGQLQDGEHASDPEHQQLASFPMRMGGFGTAVGNTLCRNCVLGIMGRRIADDQGSDSLDCAVVTSLSSAVPPAGCLAELHEAATINQQGFWWRPSWTALWEGKRPDASEARDPGEWRHGWQYWASSVSDSSFRKTTTNRPASRRSHLQSHSGTCPLSHGLSSRFPRTCSG